MRSALCRLVVASIALLLWPLAAATDTARPAVAPGAATVAAAAIGDAVDGRRYGADFGHDGKAASGKDVVTFHDGLMSTDLCIRFGFKPAPYMVRVEGSRVHFRSEMVSAEQGRMVFTGHIEGGRLTARAEWARKRWYWTVHVVSWFDGRLAGPDETLPVFIK